MTRASGSRLVLNTLEDRALPAPLAGGLFGEYFARTDLTARVLTRTDPGVDFTWNEAAPAPELPADNFSVRWSGLVEPQFTQTYTFETQSDDGVRLWVNNQLIINQWNDHPLTIHTGQIALVAGQRYDIKLEFYERGGGAIARLLWSSPSRPKQVVPADRLFSDQSPGTQYFLTTGLKTWPQAQAEAVARGGYLVSINSAAEEALIKGLFGTAEEFWIGLTDQAVEGQFAWASGEPVTHTSWAPGEPNNFGNEDYATINNLSQNGWNDWNGSALFRGIIEVPPPAPPPPGPGKIALAASAYAVNEPAGSITIGIERRNGTDGSVTVRYHTVAVTATDGADFTGVASQVVFGPGESFKTVTIPIRNDTLAEETETFVFILDSVAGGATFGTPRTATIAILDDEVTLGRLFGYDTFTDSSALALNGSARLTGGALRLTDAVSYQAGSAYRLAPIEVSPITSFSTRFSFRMTGGTAGGDGMAFVLQNAPAGPAALGTAGEGQGYGGTANSLTIEFDTFRNSYDINANHIAAVPNGNPAAAVAQAPALLDLNGGARRNAWIDYNGRTERLDVYLSSTTAKPANPRLTATVELDRLVGSRMFVGFTGGTGGLTNVHEVLTWEFSADAPELPPDPDPPVTSEDVVTGLFQPIAIDWSPDGRNLYVAERQGVIRVLRDGDLVSGNVIDVRDRVNWVRDRGLSDISVHPDLANHPYLYLLYAYDPPEVYDNEAHPLAGPDRPGNRPGRLTRVTLDAATDYTRVVPGSEVVLVGGNGTWGNFNAFVSGMDDLEIPPSGILPDGTNVPDFIAIDSDARTVGAVEFGPDGRLYVSIGDGTSFNGVDPRTVRVQDIDNLSGKVLRLDPLTGAGPADNPFFNGDPMSNRSRVYQLGLRNPSRLGIDPVTGQVYVGDVGWSSWEEINTGGPGANFGWPYYEGGSGTSLRTEGYQDLPEAQAFYEAGTPVVPAIYALNHLADGFTTIVMGDVYRGTTYPEEYRGNLFFNDLEEGVVRTARLDAAGRITSIETFTAGAEYVVQIKQGPDGRLYYVDLDNHSVGVWNVS